MKEFKIIDPKNNKLTAIREVVQAWKVTQNVPEDNKAWDRIFFKRYVRAAKDLIDLLGGAEQAVDCIQFLVNHFDSSGLSYTMETMVKWSDYYRKEGAKRERKPDPYFGRIAEELREERRSQSMDQ
jgi:hypothetical protein